jgi:hypothetical protein
MVVEFENEFDVSVRAGFSLMQLSVSWPYHSRSKVGKTHV